MCDEVFPYKGQSWWDLAFLSFRTYVLLAPLGLFVWDAATSASRIRGAWEQAAGIVGGGYMISFLLLLVAGLFAWAFRNFDAMVKCLAFMLLAFLFPFLIAEGAGLLAIAISVFMIGFKFARDRRLPKTPKSNEDEAFNCPACQATVSKSEHVCPRCAWTYLSKESASA